MLRRRLHGVITARHYVMLDYDVPATLVDAGLRHHPGPGVADRLAAAEQATGARCGPWCRASGTNAVMDELYDLGARAILVTDIAACRL